MIEAQPPDNEPRRRGRPPNQDGAVTHGRILLSALELFGRQGYAGTSLRQIAAAVGIRDSAIYAHFDSKESIYLALVEEYGPGLLKQLDVDGRRLADEHPSRALPQLVHQLVDIWDAPEVRNATSMLIREGLVGISDALAVVQTQLSTAFTIWREQGHVRNDVPVELMVWELVSPMAAIRLLYLQGQASTEKRREGRRLAEQHVAYVIATIVRVTGSTEQAYHSPERLDQEPTS